ncbi:hypothetical protein EHM69_03885 [candidate division KSB1 bacterium]|nr:MAG: hypothetical protein EHM69_03885 [candidate division KSB1 bacterium]
MIRTRGRSWIVFVISLLLILWNGPSSFASERLTESQLPPYENRLVVLRAQADLQARNSQPVHHMRDLQRRHRSVVFDLKNAVANSQSPLIETINALQAEGEILSYRPFFIVNVIAVRGTAHAFDLLAAMPGVDRVEPDYEITFVRPDVEPVRGQRTLDDAEAGLGLRSIRAPEVWAMGITGAGIIVSTFDSGVNGTHPALTTHWRGNCGHPYSECWLDLAGSTTTPTDAVGHGSQTMGILCGMVERDTVGVAWGAQFIAARIGMSSSPTIVSTAIEAFEWAIDPDGNPETFEDIPRVLSCSWGLESSSIQPCYTIFNTALDNCEAAGISIFWAAGNEGEMGEQTIRIPADRAVTATNSFAVGAYNNTTGSIYSKSSRGPSPCSPDPALQIKPELVAPGCSIRSTCLGTTYALGTGTSFAAPHAAGTAALMLEANPLLTPDSLKKIMLLTAVDLGVDGEDNTYGYGQIDAYAAVMGALGGIGWVSGQVSDVYGFNLAAVVTIAGNPQWCKCDSNGFFTLPVPAQWPFVLQIHSPTYDTTRIPLSILPGDTLSLEVILNLSSTCGLLRGTVTTCLGQSGAGSQVWVSDPAIPVCEADANGFFHTTLHAGTYSVHASNGYCAEGIVPAIEVYGRGATDIEIILPVNPSHLCSNRDSYGYQVCDDYDPGGPVYKWKEIVPSAGGKGIIHNLSNDAAAALAAPFPIRFYGVTRNRLYLNSNGNASFINPFLEYTNTTLPRGMAPVIYPFWDDLCDNLGGDICSYYEPAEAAFILEWKNVPRYDGQGNETFQLVIYDPAVYPTTTGDAVLECRYEELSEKNGCTVGIEGLSGTGSLQYAYNGAYPAHANPIQNGRAIRFTAGDRLPGTPHLELLNPVLDLSAAAGVTVDTAIVIRNTGTAPAGFAANIVGEIIGNYSWTSSRLTGGPAYQFTDISGLGVNLGIARDDTTTDTQILPWLFPMYGRYFDRLVVCSNGYLSFVSWNNDRSWNPNPLSDQHDPYYLLSPYWVDLDITSGGAVLKYYDAAQNRFIIQWNQIRRYHESGANTFQTILYPDGMIEFVYAAMSTPLNNGTVGVKGKNAAEVVQLAYCQAFLQSNTLVRFYCPDTASVRCTMQDHQQGVIGGQDSLRIPLKIQNRTLSFGERSWPIGIRSTDPQSPELLVQVNMQSMPAADNLHLLIIPDVDGIRLIWDRVPAPRYCVYSGASLDAPLDYREASVTDTFITLPYQDRHIRFFDVRLCDEP